MTQEQEQEQKQLVAQMAERQGDGIAQKMNNARVAIAGLGGLGSNVAVMLARMGIGKLLLVDYDVVEASNLNRQHYRVQDIGTAKSSALAKQLGDINPFVQVEMVHTKITADNISQLFHGYPVVCEAFDQPQEKAMLVNKILADEPEIKVVSASGMAGLHSANRIHTTKKMKNLYVCGDLEHEYTKAAGIMAPRVMLCAAHQATIIARILTGMEEEGE